MKKNFKLEINQPCNENVANMKKVEDGFFCSVCAKNVIDLSSKTHFEIEKFISETDKKSTICARLKKSQLEENYSYNIPEKSNNLKYAAAIAATVILSANVVGQENTVVPKDSVHQTDSGFKLGKMIAPSVKIETISFDFVGKLIDVNTNKPLSRKKYPFIVIHFNDSSSSQAKINAKTGEFKTPITIKNDIKETTIEIISNDYHLSKIITIDLKSIKNKQLVQIIKIDTKQFEKFMISGDMIIVNPETPLPPNK